MDIEELKSFLASGHFHHATYRTDFARGLHVYRYALQDDSVGFNGFCYVGMFSERTEECKQAQDLVRETGVYEGAYR